MTFGTPARLRTSGECPPPQPSTWKACTVRPVEDLERVGHQQALVEAVGVHRHLDVVLLGDRQCGVKGPGMGAHVLVDLEPAGATLGERLDQRSRPGGRSRGPRKPMLTGQASKAANAVRSAQGELTPTPHTGPNSCPMIDVTPEASEASMTRGLSRCTWVSTAPAVAMRPSPLTIAVPVPTTTSTPSRVWGLPARPIAAIRPWRMPIEVLRTPRTGSRTRTLVTTRSHVSRTVAASRCIPSRAGRAKPVRNSSPGTWESCSTSTTRPVSPRATRSPVVGPYAACPPLTPAPRPRRPGSRTRGLAGGRPRGHQARPAVRRRVRRSR